MATPAAAAERCALLAEALRKPGAVELPDGVAEDIGARVIFGTDSTAYEYLSDESQPYPFVVGSAPGCPGAGTNSCCALAQAH